MNIQNTKIIMMIISSSRCSYTLRKMDFNLSYQNVQICIFFGGGGLTCLTTKLPIFFNYLYFVQYYKIQNNDPIKVNQLMNAIAFKAH